jgi:signal transduction histidine kinase
VESEEPHAFSAHAADLLKALGNQAAVAIENTRLFESTQQSLKEVNALYQISQGLAASLDTDRLIQDVLTMLKQNFGYYYAQICLLDVTSGDLVFKKGSDEVGAKLFEQGFHLPRGKGIIGYVAETGTPFVTNNVNDVVFFDRNPLLPNTQSELAVPLKVEGNVVGVLDIQHEPPQRLSDEDLQLMSAVADQLAVALQKANLYADLQKSLQQEKSTRSQLLQAERLALIGQLLASISHELNNPLQTIQNALFLLKDELKNSEDGLQVLSIISSEADRMGALLDQLRSTYRPAQTEEFKPVQINGIIQDVHTLISTHLRHKSINFVCQLEPDLPLTHGISDHIKQVTLNLFMNAVEAMPDGGNLLVETCSSPAKDEILFSVKDSGLGIDPDLLPRIFQPFVTNKEAGTGLGLTITHEIVQQHEGRILAENSPDGGAKFTVWLPVWRGNIE